MTQQKSDVVYGWIEEMNGPMPDFRPAPGKDDPRWVYPLLDQSDVGSLKDDPVELRPFGYIRY